MSIVRLSDLRGLLAFYVEGGVDAMLDEAPVNRFTAEALPPRSSEVPAGEPSLSREALPRTRSPFGSPAGVTPNVGSRTPSLSSAAGGGGAGEGAPPAPDAGLMAARRGTAPPPSLGPLGDPPRR